FGWLVAEIPTLHVEEAGWEVNRSPDDAPGRYDAPQLTGCVAYLDAGPVLRRLLGEPQQAMGRELLSECIRGIVQAETFFIRERGFESGDAYDAFWDRMYAGSCRYYSHPEQVERPWSEYVGSAPRGLNLYNRSITTSGRLDDDGRFMVAGAFVDTFHELGVRVIMDRAGRVARAAGAFVRAPDRICFTTVEHLAALTGRDFPSLTKKELGIMAGGSTRWLQPS
ncbi:MAG: hypothetical protein NUV35_07820, partial [Syntrophomonadaceae bacterium]|nr:hypothetical protein [Syntrophomonadaceae bacterium]